MGDYTEFFARGLLKKDTPEIVIDLLRTMAGDFADPPILDYPDHPLFKTRRWPHLGWTASAFWVTATESVIRKSNWSLGQWEFDFHASLKNYEGVIGKFFDWIDPYLELEQNEFIGYQINPGSLDPYLYRKH